MIASKAEEKLRECQERIEHNGFWCETVDCKNQPEYIIKRDTDWEVVAVCREHATVSDTIIRWYNKVWRVWDTP